jgi:DNA-binding HxlR family transcriptional regulator
VTGTRRGYHQFCGLARALDLVGERWTLLIVREFLLGPRRYSELLEALPGLTTNLLAARLRSMEADGLIEPAPEGYRLTERGAALEPVVMELARFGGAALTTPRRTDRVDLGWGLLSLKRRYVGGVETTLALEVEGVWFTLGFERHWLRVLKSRPVRSAAVLHLTAEQARAVFFAGAPLQRAQVDGDVVAARRALSALLPAAFAHRPTVASSEARWTPQTQASAKRT